MIDAPPMLSMLPAQPVASLREILRYFTQEVYYTRPFVGASTDGYPAIRKRLDRLLTAPWIAATVRAGHDPVSHVLADIHACLAPPVQPKLPLTIVDRWERAEVPLNARLRVVFALLQPRSLGRLVQGLLPTIPGIPPLRVAKLDSSREPYYLLVGKPDALLYGSGTLLMVEMKVRGAASRHTYAPSQLLKYLTLARLASQPRMRPPVVHVIHVILTPRDHLDVFARPSGWLAGIDPPTGRVRFDARQLHSRSLAGELETVPVFLRSYEALARIVPEVAALRNPLHDMAERVLRRLVRYATTNTSGRPRGAPRPPSTTGPV